MHGTQPAAPTPQEIAFGGYGHVEDLAQGLKFLLNDLCLDLYYNYTQNPGFQETYSEACSLLETAKYIHAAEHANDRDTISRKLGGADALFHHFEDDVRGWSRVHRRQIGTLGILSKMEMTASVLHHLMEDVGTQPEIPEQAPAPAVGGPELAPPPSTFGPRQSLHRSNFSDNFIDSSSKVKLARMMSLSLVFGLGSMHFQFADCCLFSSRLLLSAAFVQHDSCRDRCVERVDSTKHWNGNLHVAHRQQFCGNSGCFGADEDHCWA